ncbi:MAG: phosphatidylserine decarboxylase family protein, partial [Bacteroidetes bacterium]|nr:phosphatidylserine decarboxylase family protein [Bacteroidota bacterium]
MTIHKEGRSWVLISTVLLGLTITYFNATSSEWFWLKLLLLATVAFFWLAFVQFFRLPKRVNSAERNELVAPCDGKVVVIEEVEEPEYFKDKRIQVSIFMSPINVHANWTPCGGEVSYVKYHPGKYLVAWHPKSSTENERSTVVVKAENGKEVLFRQIAGALARRICYYVKPGQIIEQGSEFGFIKFGSRVDLYFPLGTKIHCKIGDKTTGNET